MIRRISCILLPASWLTDCETIDTGFRWHCHHNVHCCWLFGSFRQLNKQRSRLKEKIFQRVEHRPTKDEINTDSQWGSNRCTIFKVYMTDFFLFALKIKSPQCTGNGMYSKEKFSIANFLPRVLILKFHYPWVTKQRDQKQETGNDCDAISGLQASRKTDFSCHFLIVS